MSVLEVMKKECVIPVVVLNNAENALPTARALLEGGISTMEITFRTDAALAAIKAVKTECPEMHVGAGTVINVEQCRAALDAGAEFIVCPGFDEAIVAECQAKGVPVLPGCTTTTEIMRAIAMGLSLIKFFPANIYGGLKTMKALRGPFPMLQFMPTGGINEDNLAEYMKTSFIPAVGGSWFCPASLIEEKHFDEITARCKAARETVKSIRS